MDYEQTYSAKMWGMKALFAVGIGAAFLGFGAGVVLFKVGGLASLFSLASKFPRWLLGEKIVFGFMVPIITIGLALFVITLAEILKEALISMRAKKDWRVYVDAGILDYQTPDESIAPSFRLFLEEITWVRKEIRKDSEDWTTTWFLCLKNGSEIEILESHTPLSIKKLRQALAKSGYPIKYSEVVHRHGGKVTTNILSPDDLVKPRSIFSRVV
jgi:hypothetical protein